MNEHHGSTLDSLFEELGEAEAVETKSMVTAATLRIGHKMADYVSERANDPGTALVTFLEYVRKELDTMHSRGIETHRRRMEKEKTP